MWEVQIRKGGPTKHPKINKQRVVGRLLFGSGEYGFSPRQKLFCLFDNVLMYIILIARFAPGCL